MVSVAYLPQARDFSGLPRLHSQSNTTMLIIVLSTRARG